MSELKYTVGQMNNIMSSSLEYFTNWKEAEKENKRLTASIAELEAENERLKDAWFAGETICPDGSLRPKVSALLERIAELEATVEIHADISNAYEKRISEIVSLSNKANAKLQARIAELEAEVTKCHELQDAYCDRIAELEEYIADLEKAGDSYVKKSVTFENKIRNLHKVIAKQQLKIQRQSENLTILLDLYTSGKRSKSHKKLREKYRTLKASFNEWKRG